MKFRSCSWRSSRSFSANRPRQAPPSDADLSGEIPWPNDPAATSDAKAQRVYDRVQFERNWMTSTGGIVYVIHPSSVALPQGNW